MEGRGGWGRGVGGVGGCGGLGGTFSPSTGRVGHIATEFHWEMKAGYRDGMKYEITHEGGGGCYH